MLLGSFCLVPLLILGVLALLPRNTATASKMVSGNVLLDRFDGTVKSGAVLHPLIHTMRTCNDEELRGFMLGLRHFPLQQSAAILKQAMHRSDPEVQIYAQSILQEKQETLQAAFTRSGANASNTDATSLANYLEAGLDLISSPLTQASEEPSLLMKMRPTLNAVLTTDANHPRLVAAAIELCLLSNSPREAQLLLTRLPEASPLREKYQGLVSYHLAVHQPPEPAPARYQIS